MKFKFSGSYLVQICIICKFELNFDGIIFLKIMRKLYKHFAHPTKLRISPAAWGGRIHSPAHNHIRIFSGTPPVQELQFLLRPYGY